MLLLLWSKTYLHSEWCSMELAHMRAREQEFGLRSAANPAGLVVVGVIHDGDEMPADLGAIQNFKMDTLFNTRMRKDSEEAAKLEALLRSHASTLSKIINDAPAFRAAWATAAATQFFNAYNKATAPSQDVAPSFTQT
jgi:hypothetical protein